MRKTIYLFFIGLLFSIPAISQDILPDILKAELNRNMEALKNETNYAQIKQSIMPCESSLESAYIDVNGKFFPCSFCPDTPGWEEGLDVVSCTDFIKDIWMHPRTIEFRKKLIKGGRKCPLYNI